MRTKRRTSSMLPLAVAALVLAGAGVEPARAGLLGDLVDKAKRKAEAELRQKAEESKAQLDRKLAGVIEGIEAEVDPALGGAVGSVRDTIEAAADGALGPVAGAAGVAVPRTPPFDGPTGFVEGGAFFLPPRGIASSSDIQTLLRSRSRAQGAGDPVERLRRQAQDAYHGFWMSWYGAMEQLDVAADALRQQRTRLVDFGAAVEAARVAAQIGTLEDEIRRRAESAPWEGGGSAQAAPLAVFGLNVESGAIPKEVVIASLSQTVALLAHAHASAETDEARQRIVALARDVTTIRDRMDEGNLAAAQELMDRRWSWVMAD